MTGQLHFSYPISQANFDWREVAGVLECLDVRWLRALSPRLLLIAIGAVSMRGTPNTDKMYTVHLWGDNVKMYGVHVGLRISFQAFRDLRNGARDSFIQFCRLHARINLINHRTSVRLAVNCVMICCLFLKGVSSHAARAREFAAPIAGKKLRQLGLGSGNERPARGEGHVLALAGVK